MIVTPFTHERIHKTMWDVHPSGNVFPGLTVWDVHKNANVFLGLTVCDIHIDINVFLGFTVWDVHTYRNDFVGLPCGMYIPTEMIGFRCLAQSHTAPACVPGGPILDDSKCRRGKGLKTVCLGLTHTSDDRKKIRSAQNVTDVSFL